MVAGELGKNLNYHQTAVSVPIFPLLSLRLNSMQTEIQGQTSASTAWLKDRKWFLNVQSEEGKPTFLFFLFYILSFPRP